MGDPRKHRKKFSTPVHPWQKARIEDEKGLTEEYGLKNKKEIWKMVSKVKSYARQAKSLIARTGPQGLKEKKELLAKLHSLNLLPKNADLDDVLGLSTRNIMERRLQTLVFKRGLATSIKQARQFVVHGHIVVGDKKITSPSYLVRGDEENKIGYVPTTTVGQVTQEAKKK